MAPLERLDVNHCEDRQQIVLHRARYDFVLARLQPGQQVLEIGTGTGAFTNELSKKCSTYMGLEYDAAACELSRQNAGPGVTILQGDARHLPFEDNQFSFVVCLEVLEHLGDFQAGVREIHRCIKPNGTAIISVPYRKVGKKNATPYHPYEPGEQELVCAFGKLFNQVEVFYQYFEETTMMTFARKLHLRRLFGFHRIYGDLSAGLPNATAKYRIGEQSGGMNVGLLLVVEGKK